MKVSKWQNLHFTIPFNTHLFYSSFVTLIMLPYVQFSRSMSLYHIIRSWRNTFRKLVCVISVKTYNHTHIKADPRIHIWAAVTQTSGLSALTLKVFRFLIRLDHGPPTVHSLSDTYYTHNNLQLQSDSCNLLLLSDRIPLHSRLVLSHELETSE